jgi:hypothetical protein
MERRNGPHIDFLHLPGKLALIRRNKVQRGVQTQLAMVYYTPILPTRL